MHYKRGSVPYCGLVTRLTSVRSTRRRDVAHTHTHRNTGGLKSFHDNRCDLQKTRCLVGHHWPTSLFCRNAECDFLERILQLVCAQVQQLNAFFGVRNFDTKVISSVELLWIIMAHLLLVNNKENRSINEADLQSSCRVRDYYEPEL